MRFGENRVIAWCVLAACVFASIFGLGGFGLMRERSQAVRLFNDGSDTTLSMRHSMDAYLDLSADSAAIMASEAEMLGVNTALTGEIAELSQIIGEGNDLDARYLAYQDIKTKADQLYNAVYSAADKEKAVQFKIAYDDFWGYEDMIIRDDYHKAARDFNRIADAFPGKIVAYLYGIEPLSTFGG